MTDPRGFTTAGMIERLSRNPAFAERWAVEQQKSILAANVAKLRHERGLTQLDLAVDAGMKQPRIAEIESGEANPKLETLARIAAALGVSMGDLFADGESAGRTETRFSAVASRPGEHVPSRG